MRNCIPVALAMLMHPAAAEASGLLRGILGIADEASDALSGSRTARWQELPLCLGLIRFVCDTARDAGAEAALRHVEDRRNDTAQDRDPRRAAAAARRDHRAGREAERAAHRIPGP